MGRPAGSLSAFSPISFREAQHRLAAQKGMTLGQASTALSGTRGGIGSTIAPGSTGIKGPSMRINTGVFKSPKLKM